MEWMFPAKVAFGTGLTDEETIAQQSASSDWAAASGDGGWKYLPEVGDIPAVARDSGQANENAVRFPMVQAVHRAAVAAQRRRFVWLRFR
jgi:hypothetical protein